MPTHTLPPFFPPSRYGPPIIPGLAEGLEVAKRNGVKCIAVTNAPRGAAEACIQSLRDTIPAASCISDTIIIGAECTRAKPYPDPYLEGMKALGAKPDRCLIFEDSSSGIKAAVAANVRAVVGLQSGMDAISLGALGCTSTPMDWSDVTDEWLAKLMRKTAKPPNALVKLTKPIFSFASLIAHSTCPPAAMILGLALSALPAYASNKALLCKGADQEVPAAAMRLYGAGLLPLAALMVAAQGSSEAEPRQAQALALALLASGAMQLDALLSDGHALKKWAKRAVVPPMVGSAIVGASSLLVKRG